MLRPRPQAKNSVTSIFNHILLCVSSKDAVNINKFLFEKYKQSLDCLAQDGVCAATDGTVRYRNINDGRSKPLKELHTRRQLMRGVGKLNEEMKVVEERVQEIGPRAHQARTVIN